MFRANLGTMLEVSSFSALTGVSVDVEKGIISGVSVITAGEAKGHLTKTGLQRVIDATTLSQVLTTATSHSGGIKVKLNHATEVKLEATCGTLKNFRLDGKQLRADLYLLKSDPHYGKILELAQTVPEDFGLSLVVRGRDEVVQKLSCIRCEEILSADLVDAPAANPTGLFSQPSTRNKQTMTTEEMAESIKSLTETVESLKTSKLSALPQDVTDKLTKLESLEKTITELSTKQADAVKLAEKAQKDLILADAARDGKVVPVSATTIETLSVEVLREMVSKLSKGVVSTQTKTKFTVPDKAEDRATALAAKREEGKAELTAMFAARGLTV